MCTFCSDLGAAFATPYTKNRRGHKIKFLLKLCGSKMRIDRETITRLRIKPREYIGSFEIAFCFGCGHEHNCGVYGCAVIREAIKTAKLYQAAHKVLERQRDCDTCLYNNPCGMDDLRCTVCTRGQKWKWDRGGVE
jgi:hypothetical protein